jgi:hypothetical protein
MYRRRKRNREATHRARVFRGGVAGGDDPVQGSFQVCSSRTDSLNAVTSVGACVGKFILRSVLLCCAVSGAGAGEIHKWTDENGVVHYGEAAPANQPSTAIETPEPEPSTSAPISAQERMENQYRAIEQLSEERIRRREEKEKAAAEDKKRAGACARLKDRAVTLRDGGRLYNIKPDGTREYLTDETRQARLAEAEAQLKKYCR